MEDGGRSARGRAAAAAAKKNKEKEKNDGSTLQKQPRHPVPFAQIPGITNVLLDRLEVVGATGPPSFMIGKSLMMSDVSRNQARLFFSCKRRSLPELSDAFTETEMRFIEDNLGLLVTAFDRDGRRYDLTFKYLESNSGYRFVTGWRAYVEDNGLGVGTSVELWCFRSRKLLNRHEQREREGKKEKIPIMVESGHPDGSLGLVLLHYGNNDMLEPEQAAAEEPDEAPPVKETAENSQEPEQAADDEPDEDEAPPVQETETGHMESKKMTTTAEDKLADNGGTCAEPIKSKTTIAEDKLADDTVISDEDMDDAAKGLIQLRWHYEDQAKKYCGGGGGGGRRRPGT